MAAVLTATQMLTAGSAYAINILSSRTLGPEGRGFVVLALQLTYLAAVLVVLGIERPFLASVRMPFPGAFRAFASFLRPAAVISALVFVAGAVVCVAGYVTVGLAVIIGAGYMLLNGLGKGVRVAAISAGDPRMLVWFTLGTQGTMVVVASAFAALSVHSALVWFSAYAATGLTSLIILVVVLRRPSEGTLSPEERHLIRGQGMRLLPASIGNTAMVRSDRLILPAFAGVGALGVYSAVSTVMEMAAWPIAQWVDASLGRWKHSGVGARRSALLKLSVRAVVVAAVFAALVGTVAYLSIVWLLPEDFLPSIPLIVPLALSSVIYALSRVQQGLLVAQNRGEIVSIVELLGMGASVIAYFAMIPAFGVMGAALGSLVGYGVAAVAGAVALYVRQAGAGADAAA